MGGGRPSASAQHVALVRSHLTWLGVVDDPYAHQMLRPLWRNADRALRWRPLTGRARNTAFGFLGGRTCFFDDEVDAALDDGARQVVVLAAGYDSRAWRLGRDGVRFFELDHTATQTDKRARAPEGGPAYVAADLATDPWAERLVDAGFEPDVPTVFTVEGVTMYLSEDAVVALLQSLSALGGPGSRLVVNFRNHDLDPDQRDSRVKWMRAFVRAGGEEWRFGLDPARAAEFLATTGWTEQCTLTATDLADRYLVGTPLAKVEADRGGFVTSAAVSR